MACLERPDAAFSESDRLDALVVLGCRVQAGQPSRALESRLELALKIRLERARGLGSIGVGDLGIIVSGGRSWEGTREADVMAAWLRSRGVPLETVILERESLTTRQNARKVAAILSAHSWRRIGLVTSDFHMRRAAHHFRNEGVLVELFPAQANLGFLVDRRLRARELCARLLAPFEPRGPSDSR